MRIRTIKPEFWGHPVMGRQADHVRLLAIGLLNYADDEGYFYADDKLIRSALRPFDDDSKIVLAALKDLSRVGYVEVKEHPTHGLIGRVVSFTEHQRVDKPKSSTIKPLFDSTNDLGLIEDESTLYGNGMEGNGILPDKPAVKPSRPRERNELLDTLATLSGADLSEITETAWGSAAAALKVIRKVKPDVTPDEIRHRAANYRKKFTKAAVTAPALAKHWADCAGSAASAFGPAEKPNPYLTPEFGWSGGSS